MQLAVYVRHGCNASFQESPRPQPNREGMRKCGSHRTSDTITRSWYFRSFVVVRARSCNVLVPECISDNKCSEIRSWDPEVCWQLEVVFPSALQLIVPLRAKWELRLTNKTNKQKEILVQFPLRFQFLCFRPVDRLCVRSPGERAAAKEPSVINRAQFSSLFMCVCVCVLQALAGFKLVSWVNWKLIKN